MAADLKVDRTVANKLAVDFYRNGGVTRHAQCSSLKVFYFWRGDLWSKDDILHVAEQLDVIKSLEDENVEQAIVDDGLLEEWKWTAVEAAVTDQNKGAFFGYCIFRLDAQSRRRARGNMRSRDKVTQWAEAAL